MLIIICLILVLFAIVGSYCVCCYIKHEKWQSEKINKTAVYIDELQSELQIQRQQLEEFTEKLAEAQEFPVSWSEQAFNYLAIGNSITAHSVADYWWNDGVGMAASSEEKDYVHRISKWLKQNYNKTVETYAYNFYIWEVQANDRAETLQLLDMYLSDKLDLITIQLSENVSDISTLEEDFEELFRYLFQKCPNAKIIVIDDFWDNGEKSLMKENAAQACNVDFVSLSDIKGNAEYQAGLGTIVYDENENRHIVEHEGVAAHPGDKGMLYIAEAVEKRINTVSIQ